MKRIQTKAIRNMISVIIALAAAGIFFSYLGAAPGYEGMFRALMIIVLSSIVIIASRALNTINNRTSTDSALHCLTKDTASRHFQNITIKDICQS